MSPSSIHPSNLELQALSILWYHGPSTVAVVREALPDKKARAYTTVLSVMQSLERKSLVTRALVGRTHVYAAAQSQDAIIRRATNDYLTNAFGGRLHEALLAILSAGTLTPEEARSIERELQKHKVMAAKDEGRAVSKNPSAKKSGAAAPAKKAAQRVVRKVARSARKVAKKATKKTVAGTAAAAKTAAKQKA